MFIRNLSLMLFAMVCAIGAGAWYSNQQFKESMGPKRTNLSFWLLDQSGELVKFPDPSSKTTLIYYMPDNVTSETQLKFMEIIENRKKYSELGVRVIPVSRTMRDNLINLQEKSGFWGPIVHDPSGIVLQFFKQFRSEWKNDHWVSAMFDEKGKLLWSEIAQEPIITDSPIYTSPVVVSNP